MKILIITVAGCSSRFSKSIGYETLKCIYYKKDYTESLLFRLLNQSADFDKYIVVGGYKYDELRKCIEEWFPSKKDKIELVRNPFYKKYGSGYSLFCGIEAAMKYNFDEMMFVEGDLFVDSNSFLKVANSAYNVITCNNNPILAKKAVVLYFDISEKIHYIYDTTHKTLIISEPFISIYNSGQIWKMTNNIAIRKIFESMKSDDWKGTNLVFIEKYFSNLDRQHFEIIGFEEWVNCNTIDDFNMILGEKNENYQ